MGSSWALFRIRRLQKSNGRERRRYARIARRDMPVFARRRLQSMLDGLAPLLSLVKAKDILKRLEHKNAKDALAAEVELGLLWSINQVAHLEIEPVLALTPAPHDPMLSRAISLLENQPS